MVVMCTEKCKKKIGKKSRKSNDSVLELAFFFYYFFIFLTEEYEGIE